MTEVRLQKFLADAGVASRRAAEVLIAEGKVSVDGRVVSTMGAKVEPGQTIKVNGKTIEPNQEKVIYAFHKPRGVVSTNSDPHATKTVASFFPSSIRVFPVGRLDKDSEGLMLVTNDGALAYSLTHPKHEHEKEYEVALSGKGKPLEEFEKPYKLMDGAIRPMQLVHARKLSHDRWQVRLILREGRKRQIREVAELLGYRVGTLTRIRIGKLHLGTLPPGKWKKVTREEII
jgi:23S rRNA pseudouridine2605 synthase